MGLEPPIFRNTMKRREEAAAETIDPELAAICRD
jgi:hypothetical protein